MPETLNVVVADPEAQVRAAVVGIVNSVAKQRGLNLAVHEASTGPLALAACTAHRPQLVVCEVLLEGMSGLELMRNVAPKTRGSDAGTLLTQVVFVTNLDREHDRYWGLRCGALAYLAKPFDEIALRERVERVLTEGDAAQPDTPSGL